MVFSDERADSLLKTYSKFSKNFPELCPFHSISARKSRKIWLNGKASKFLVCMWSLTESHYG